MKKVGKVMLIAWAVLATILLVMLYREYSDTNMDWSIKYTILKSEYDEAVEKAYAEDAVMFDSWAGLVSKEHYAYTIDDQTVVTVVYAEGRTLDEMADELKSHMVTFKSMLGKTPGVLLVMNDNNEVWFGYTFSDGKATSLVNANYMD